MSHTKSNPPRLALWLLLHACPGSHNQALAGDLVEKFREGQSRGWFWKQVLIAIAVGVLAGVPRHWPNFSYAISGTAMVFLAKAFDGTPAVVHWWALPWPWSMLVLEMSPTALFALAALPVLAAALVINGAFRWVTLLQTGMISLTLLALGHYSLDVFPWLLRPIPGNPYLKTLIIAPTFQMLVCFSTFLVSASLGCRSLGRSQRIV